MIFQTTGNNFTNINCQKIADNLNKSFNYQFNWKRYNTYEL